MTQDRDSADLEWGMVAFLQSALRGISGLPSRKRECPFAARRLVVLKFQRESFAAFNVSFTLIEGKSAQRRGAQ